MKQAIVFIVIFLTINACSAQCPAVEECLARDKTCTVLPAPFPHDPSTSEKGWDLTKLRESVWSFYNGETGALITFDNETLTVIDAPRSESSFLTDGRLKQNLAINSVLRGNKVSRIRLVYGHRHYDHIGTFDLIYASLQNQYPEIRIAVYANLDTIRYLRRDPKRQLPKITHFVPYKGMFIKSSDNLTHRLFVRRGHTLSDMIILIPKNRRGDVGVAHLADYVTTKFAPWYSIGVSLDIYSVMATLRFMLSLDFAIFSPGHGFVGDKQDLRTTLEYIRDTIAFSKEAESEITPEQLAAANFSNVFTPGTTEFGNRHYLSKVFVDLINDMCTRKLIRKYGCVIGGVAIMAPSHCQTAYIYEVIETYDG